MFSRTKQSTLLDRATDRAIRELDRHPIGSENYVKTMDLVERLHRLKQNEKADPVSKDTLALVSANLLGIIMIIKHEYVNVITSRAMNLLIKPR